MILSFFFHHSNRFIHEPVMFSPRFKNPDAHGISAVVNRLKLVIDLTDILWNLHFDADHAESLSLSTVKLVVSEVIAIPKYEGRACFEIKRFQLECGPKMVVFHRLQLDIFFMQQWRGEGT